MTVFKETVIKTKTKKGLSRDMSILGKYTDNIEEDNFNDTQGYTIPVVVKNEKGQSLKKDITISAILHPVVLGMIYLISLILLFFGITFNVFERPKPKMKDIEFVLVDKEDTPINKNTPYRSDINSRAGGHHDPTKKVSMPSPKPSASKKTSPAPQQPAKAQTPTPAPKQQTPKPQPAKKPSITEQIQKAVQQPTPAPKQEPTPPAPKAPQAAKPAPPTARPSIKPPMTPKTVAKPSSAFQVPVPSGGTKSGSYATGPISGSGTANKGGGSGGPTSGSGNSGGSYTPAPSLAPTGGGSSSGQKLAKGGGGGTGGLGNPGPGNPNGRPGIDTIREPDFGPYMRELQRRIKMNWDPPKGNESKRVILLFKIAKDGRLLSCSVYKSSGLKSADDAALNAVKLTAPFKPLPAEYKGQSIDIQFTFDYNVFGAAGYQ